MLAGKLSQPLHPDRAARVELRVTEPMGGAQQRRPLAERRYGDPTTVARPAKPDLLFD